MQIGASFEHYSQSNYSLQFNTIDYTLLMLNHKKSPTNRNVNLTVIVQTYACLGVLYKHLNCILKSKPLPKGQNQTKSSSLFEREGLHAIYYVSEQLKKKLKQLSL